MKTWLLAIPLLAFGVPAGAAWTFVDGGEGYERYIDRETIDRSGHLVRVWEVDNNTVADASGVVSLRSRTEYDCQSRRYRIVHLSGHTRDMTEGDVVFSRAVNGEWRPVAPETLGEVSMEMACAE
ncbi:MAG: hypothetical protein NBV65_03425 [Burkholderiaceae bacterium]|nr:hypothetical protein [Burkholderiaceae bacterium]